MDLRSLIGLGNWAGKSMEIGRPDAGADPVYEYFVEYENPVSEPAAMMLPGIGLIGLAGLGMKFRKK